MSAPSSVSVVIVGAGFAGLWAALAAAHKLEECKASISTHPIAIIAPEPTLYIRPRLYESDVTPAKVDLTAVLEAVGVLYIQGVVRSIDTEKDVVEYSSKDGSTHTLQFQRLVLASGSKLYRPPVPGLIEHAFSTDQYDEALVLEEHLKGLPKFPEDAARNTVVVCGGGLTGIETAAEMPDRLRAVLGKEAKVRVVIVERGSELNFGAQSAPVIHEALSSLDVEFIPSDSVTAIDADGITTESGRRIPSKTVVWTAGLRASALTEQIPAQRDNLGRLVVNEALRVTGKVFAAGDTAFAATDDEGHHAVMSCQHALFLGRFAGHNAVADLLELPLKPYRQELYATCLDLGPWGAVFTTGWERNTLLVKAEGKAMKMYINTKVIYPPPADRAQALAAANPDNAYTLESFLNNFN